MQVHELARARATTSLPAECGGWIQTFGFAVRKTTASRSYGRTANAFSVEDGALVPRTAATLC